MAKKTSPSCSFTLAKRHAIYMFAAATADAKRYKYGIDHVQIDFVTKLITATNGVMFISVPIEVTGSPDEPLLYVHADWLKENCPTDDSDNLIDVSKIPIRTDVLWPSNLRKQDRSPEELFVSVSPSVFRIFNDYADRIDSSALTLGLSRDMSVDSGVFFASKAMSFQIFDEDCSGDKSSGVVGGGLVVPCLSEDLKATLEESREVLRRCMIESNEPRKPSQKQKVMEIDGKPIADEKTETVAAKPKKDDSPKEKPVKEKVEKPVDVDKANKKIMPAAARGDLETVNELISQGVNVNTTDVGGYTALTRASSKGHVDIVKALIKAGANVNHKPNNKIVAIQAAAFAGHLEVCRVLVAAGADVTIRDDDDWDACEKAEYNKHAEVVKYLKGVMKKGK